MTNMIKNVLLDQMILTKSAPTNAGSMMLDGYMSLFDATIVDKLREAGIEIAGKSNVGEMGFDVVGETSYFAQPNIAADLDQANAVIGFDINGAPRRMAATGAGVTAGAVCLKPTYGVVSRFGTVAIACSGEAVSVTAKSGAAVQEVLNVIAGHDNNDGTSLPQATCDKVKTVTHPIKRVAVVSVCEKAADASIIAQYESVKAVLAAAGVEVELLTDDAINQAIAAAGPAWNILMSAELCNNVSRFDGVKYGHRAAQYEDITDLYTNSRTEAFGDLLKAAILFGSETLSEDNYFPVYDKALRIRRKVVEAFAAIFENYDAVLFPAASKAEFTQIDFEANKYLVFSESAYTAPAQITGLPAVAFSGVQLVGQMFSDAALLALTDEVRCALIGAAEGKGAN